MTQSKKSPTHPRPHEGSKEPSSEGKKHKELSKKNKELTELIQRLQAEFENYKKRVEKELQTAVNKERNSLFNAFLPLLDTFDQALKSHPGDQECLQHLHKQITKIFKEQGIEPIQSLNKPFDHNYHEVVLQQESDKPEKTILEEIQKGYTLKGHVLRHTKVIIAKNGDHR